MDEIHILDMYEPVLSDAQRKHLELAERNPVELTVEAVLSAAAERTGLEDFGPRDFEQRLALILGGLDEDKNATALCRLTLFRRLVRLGATRLRALRLLARHPEIHEQEIAQPIIVAGLPRSGTTHLLNLMAADSRLQALRYWISLEPIPDPDERPGPDGVDPRYARAAAGWRDLQEINPSQLWFHPMDPDHIHEDLELQMPDYATYTWEFAYRAPQWRDYHTSHDQTQHYEFGKTMLKILQWRSGESRRWVLKCPQHFEQVPVLRKVYPDATLVFTHRDPVASLQSVATMLGYRTRVWEREPDPMWHFNYWADRIEMLLRAYLRDVELVPAERRFEVMFDAFMADDVAMVQNIFEHAGLGRSEQSTAELDRYMETHRRGSTGRVVFDMRRDFGTDPEAMRERFAFYTDALRVAVEAR